MGKNHNKPVRRDQASVIQDYKDAIMFAKSLTDTTEPISLVSKDLTSKFKVQGFLLRVLVNMGLIKKANENPNSKLHQWAFGESPITDKIILKVYENVQRLKTNREPDYTITPADLDETIPVQDVVTEEKPAEKQEIVKTQKSKEVKVAKTTAKVRSLKARSEPKAATQPKPRYVGTLFVPKQLDWIKKQDFDKSVTIRIDDGVVLEHVRRLAYVVNGLDLQVEVYVQLTVEERGRIEEPLTRITTLKYQGKGLAFRFHNNDPETLSLIIGTVELKPTAD